MSKHSHLERIDKNRLRVHNPYDVDVQVFANEEVPVDPGTVAELLELLELQGTVARLAEALPESFSTAPAIPKVRITPDFQKGTGIPIGTVLSTQGFVVPQAVGNDVNCGMRLHTTSLSPGEIRNNLDSLEAVFRYVCFEGGRNIPMSRVQREGLFRDGLRGLFEATPSGLKEGVWQMFHEVDTAQEIEHIALQGGMKAEQVIGFDDFLGPSDRVTRDTQIGSLGGGNHFLELQYVNEVFDRQTAYAWGLTKGTVTVMIHTGCVSVGHHSGSKHSDLLKSAFPNKIKHPSNGIYPLPVGGGNQSVLQTFWDTFANAANFAFGNRFFLAMMARMALQEVFGTVTSSLVYDAPHNLIWEDEIDGEDCFIHRKGACPANGLNRMRGSPFEYYGEPVMVPGSMGASSYVLAGLGNEEALCSASHGAGRALSRGKALKWDDAEFADFLERYRVVTPVDLRRQDVKSRKDIVAKRLEEIKKEAPFAYKGITPVVETLTDAGIARPVVELQPLMTVKG